MKTSILKFTLSLLLLTAIGSKMTHAYTAVASGNWSSASTWQGGIAPGSTVAAQDIIIPGGITVNMDVNVTFNGLLNTFRVDGVLNSTDGRLLTMSQGSLGGSGFVNVDNLAFALLATNSFSGVLSVETLVNNGATLGFSSEVDIDDTLDLRAGNLILNSGADMSLAADATVKVDDGQLLLSGGSFSSQSTYNVVYYGSSKSTGSELSGSSISNVVINLDDNNQTLNLSSDLTVNGTLNITSGEFDISGQSLTLSGGLSAASGTTITSDEFSELTLEGNSIMSSIEFSSGSSLGMLNIDREGSASTILTSGLEVNNELNLMDGQLTIGTDGSLVMGPSATIEVEEGSLQLSGSGTFTATNSYNVSYVGSGAITTGIELSGSGLNNLTIDVTGTGAQVNLGNDIVVNGAFNLAGGTLSLNGENLTLNGTFSQDSDAEITGSIASQLVLNLESAPSTELSFSASSQNLHTLVVNMDQPGTIDLGSDLNLVSNLTLTNGSLDLGDYDLNMLPTATISDFDSSSYVVTSGTGELLMRVNAGGPFVVFPVGTPGDFSPAQIQQLAGSSTGNFSVRATDGFLAEGTSGVDLALTENVVDQTWMVEAAAGMNVNVNLKLGWMPDDEANDFNRTEAFISHYVNGEWDGYAPGSATAGLSGTFELLRTGLTSLSPMGVSDMSVGLGLNEVATNEISVHPIPASDVLYLELPADKTYSYEVTDISGRTVEGLVATGNALDISGLKAGYYFLKVFEAGSAEPVMKKFVKS